MSAAPKCWAVLPAAGTGQRVGAAMPKQYLQIAGKTVLQHAVENFINNDRIAGLVVPLHSKDNQFSKLHFGDVSTSIDTVQGGDTRAESVLAGLNFLSDHAGEQDYVLVHDAARPCLMITDLNNLIDSCLKDEVGGILATPLTDTIKLVNQKRIVGTQDREQTWRALTPQMFKFGILKNALTSAINNHQLSIDEASAIEYAGYHPLIVEGSEKNIKVTNPDDLQLAEIYLQSMGK